MKPRRWQRDNIRIEQASPAVFLVEADPDRGSRHTRNDRRAVSVGEVDDAVIPPTADLEKKPELTTQTAAVQGQYLIEVGIAPQDVLGATVDERGQTSIWIAF